MFCSYLCVLTASCTIGKFWHRHRRPRPVLYNPDPEYHLGLRTETDKSKIYPKKKGGAAARAANTPAVDQDEPTPAPAPEPETPSKVEPVVEEPRRAPSGAGRRRADNERAVSPVSSGSSSASESPLIQKMKLNGTGHAKSDSNTPMPPPTTDDVSSSAVPGPSDRPTSPLQTAEVGESRLPLLILPKFNVSFAGFTSAFAN
jgi:SWI/SNF-related matrix-associated actin-dependent regulator of chromatin subfamily B protein 1